MAKEGHGRVVIDPLRKDKRQVSQRMRPLLFLLPPLFLFLAPLARSLRLFFTILARNGTAVSHFHNAKGGQSAEQRCLRCDEAVAI